MKRLFTQKIPFLPMLAILALAAGCAGGGSKPGGVEIVRVWPEYRAADSFDRISEYFTGKENPGGQIILRTRPDVRAGFYFFTRLKTPADIDGANVMLDVIMPESPDPKTFTLPAPLLPKGTVLLNLGLTGDDWPGAAARPVAWRLRLIAADGGEIVAQQSYLWSK